MSGSIGIGVIGCGRRVTGLAREVVKHGGGRLHIEALCDLNPAALAHGREHLGQEVRTYEQAEQLCSDSRVQWVFVGSYNACHRQHVEMAFAAGKDVFCEKPLATTIDDCLAMRDAQQQSGRKFIIGFTLRYSPHYRRIHQLLREGAIGRIVSMEFNEVLHFDHGGFIHGDWRRFTRNAGTHLLEKCCHDIDLVHWLVGSLPRRVASFGGLNFFRPENQCYVGKLGKSPKGRPAFSAWPRWEETDPFTAEKDIVDNQVAIIEFHNDVRATFHANCSSNIPERRMYFCGSEGTLRADVMTGQIELGRIGYGQEVEQIDSGGKGGHGGGDGVLTADIANCILNNAEPRTQMIDGLTSAITCFGIDQAMETGQVVQMDEWWRQAGLAGAQLVGSQS